MHAQQRHKTFLQFCLATHTEILQHVKEYFIVLKWKTCLTEEECLGWWAIVPNKGITLYNRNACLVRNTHSNISIYLYLKSKQHNVPNN